MKTRIQSGDHLTLIAPHDVSQGHGVQVGAIFGIACHQAAKGASVTLDMRHDVFRLPKPEKQAWKQGATVFWDASARLCTTASTGNRAVGAALDGPAGAEEGAVLILTAAR